MAQDREATMKIKIKIGKVEIFATLKETATAGEVFAALMKNTQFQTRSGIRTVPGTLRCMNRR
jgi:hypothetical protein